MSIIPLSYTPIDHVKLGSILKQYEEKPHTSMVADFERKLSAITGVRYVAATNSGTSAIHLALRALGVGQRDEVIVSTFTFIAAVTPICYLGAVPVFVDCDSATWAMDPELLESAIQDRLRAGIKPKAIIIVHCYGMPAQVEAIKSIADKYEISLLEDAAEAIGSIHLGSHLGTVGEVGIISFNNNKIVTTYGGGALLTNNEQIYRKALFLAEQAREPKPYYEYRESGYNYRMGSLNAAHGLAQIDFLSDLVEKRRAIYEQYKMELEPYGFSFLSEPAGSYSNRWLTTLSLGKENSAGAVLRALEKEGIEGRFLWNPMHRQPVFAGFRAFLNGLSDQLFDQGISLPSSNFLIKGDISRISDIVKRETKG